MARSAVLPRGRRISVAVRAGARYAQLSFLQSWSIWQRTTYAGGSVKKERRHPGRFRDCENGSYVRHAAVRPYLRANVSVGLSEPASRSRPIPALGIANRSREILLSIWLLVGAIGASRSGLFQGNCVADAQAPLRRGHGHPVPAPCREKTGEEMPTGARACGHCKASSRRPAHEKRLSFCFSSTIFQSRQKIPRG